MSRSSGRVRQHRADGARVGRVHRVRAAKLTLALGALLGEDVAHISAGALDAAAAADPETLGRALLRLHLRHNCFLLSCSLTPGGSAVAPFTGGGGGLKPPLLLLFPFSFAGLFSNLFFGFCVFAPGLFSLFFPLSPRRLFFCPPP